MRAFLAIDIPDETATALGRVQAMLPAGRPTPRGNLHLTLAFLDDQPEARLRDLHDALAALESRATAGFDVSFDGLGLFGGARPAILFAGVVPAPPLLALHRAVRGAVRAAGIARPRERFRPHVTLARFRPGADPAPVNRFLADHGRVALPGFRARGLTLFESVLSRDGARHDPLAQYELR